VGQKQQHAELALTRNALRDGLQKLTEIRDVSRHPILLIEPGKRLPNSIRCLSAASTHLRYNCVMYALDIHESSEYVRMAMQCPEDVHASTAFLRFLIDEQVTLSVGVPSAGDLGVYLEGDSVKHVGRIASQGRLLSKWGIGHLYDHSMEEVPTSYGSGLRFSKSVDSVTALSQFERFARNHGVRLR